MPEGFVLSDQIASLLPIIAFALIFWLLLVRPAQRRRKLVAAMQSRLSVGDEVMLSSGFYGTVHSIPEDDDAVELQLSEGVLVKVARGAITEVITRSSDADDDAHPEYAADEETVAEDATPQASDRQNPPSES